MKDDDLDLENGKQFNCPHEVIGCDVVIICVPVTTLLL